MSGPSFEEFTRDHYCNFVRQIAKQYNFRTYDKFDPEERFVLWRHDVDMSMHAALKLAQIEAEAGVRATYFLLPGSVYYNLFEPRVKRCMEGIRALGHAFGLHFDASAYSLNSPSDLEEALTNERTMLEAYCGQPITAFSFHDPAPSTLVFNQERYSGLVNCYSQFFRDKVKYVSDSNGIWRYKRLDEVLQEAPPRLQILTHPEWWTEIPMSPRARVFRCIEGRARYCLSQYNAALAAGGRDNVVEHAKLFMRLEAALGKEQALTMQMQWLRGAREGMFLDLWRMLAARNVASTATYAQWNTHATALLAGEQRDEQTLAQGIAFILEALDA